MTSRSPMIAALLLAAGSGSRFGSDIPKQYLKLEGQALICHSLRSLAAEPRIHCVQVVIAAHDPYYAAHVHGEDYPFTLLPAVTGGEERALSMRYGLAALPETVTHVAIHDAARPFPSPALLREVIDAALTYGAAVPGLPVHDTIKRINDDKMVIATPPRQQLVAVQTPQVMRRDWLNQALQQEAGRLATHTDDASVLEAAGFPVRITTGDACNRKVTTPEDLPWLQARFLSDRNHHKK